MDAKIDCNLLTLFPPQRMRRPVIFWNRLPFKTRLSQWRKDCLAHHDQSQKFLGHQSLPLLCSPKVLYQMCCRRMWSAEAMWQNGWVWVTAGHQSAPVGLEWLPSCSKNIFTRIDLGKMIIDPRHSFQTVWYRKCWYLKNAQKDVECRRGVKGWLSG